MKKDQRSKAGSLRAGVAKSDITADAKGVVVSDSLYAKALHARLRSPRLWLLACVSGSLAAAVCAADLELARDGKTPYVIVAADASEQNAPATVAAGELAKYLGRVTGAEFKVVDESAAPKDRPCIYVGPTQFAAQHGIDAARLGREEWVMRTVGKDLILAGGRPRGTLYAVYEFLEKHVGCHWLDEWTEVVPSKPTLTIPPLDVQAKPAFWYRYIYTSLHKCRWTNGGQWFRLRNKASAALPVADYPHSGAPGGCHTFHAYTTDWPEDHPEYFSMNPRGERDRSTSGAGPGHICLSNPDVQKLVLERLKQFIAKDRANAAERGTMPPRVYDISQNDNNQYVCCCPECKKISEREESESGLMVHFINVIADGIREQYPDILVQTFAYTTTQKPPKTLKPRENVLIRLCDLGAEFGCGAAEYFKPLSHEFNRPFCERIKRWSEICDHLAIWDYWILYSPNDRYPTPFVNVSFLKPDIELFLDSNAETVFVECEKPETSSFFALKRWLGYKLLQDPRQPVEPLIQAFMAGYYGPAAKPMRAYLDYLEKRILAVPTPMSTVKECDRPYFDLEFFVTCQRLFDAAEAACKPGSLDLLHVQRERLVLDSALFNMWSQLAQKLPAGQTMPFDHDTVLNRYEAHRLAQMEAQRNKASLAEGKKQLAAEMAKWRERKAVEKRKLLPMPTLRIPRIPAVPDGDVTKVDWAKARDVGVWRENEGFSTKRKLSARVAHDGANLYVQLVEQCDGTKLKSAGDIWTGDDWELFFAAKREPPYHQLGVNPEGKYVAFTWPRMIGKAPAEAWRVPVQVVSTTTAKQWAVSVSLPLSELAPGGVQPGKPFYGNLCRAAGGAKETYAWSPAFQRGFHMLKRFGEMRLE